MPLPSPQYLCEAAEPHLESCYSLTEIPTNIMIAAKWAREILDLHLPLESLLLVSLLEILGALPEVLVTLLEVLANLWRITHASWHA